MYQEFGISKELQEIVAKSEKELQSIFEEIDEISLKNSQKVLMAFQKNKVSEMHFGTSTGYGEGDVRKGLHRRNFQRSFRCGRCFS